MEFLKAIRSGQIRSGLIAVALALCLSGLAHAGERTTHGLSVFGDLKYPADFTHFDYVNPDAPKGGRLSMIGSSGVITFNSLNGFILKGDAAQGLGALFDSLMVRADDEPDAMYGLVAKSAEVAQDKQSVTFHLRAEAKFADGSPLTAEDVAFSFTTLKEKGHPQIALQLRDVEKVEVIDGTTLRYSFKGKQTRDLPLIVAGLPIFSKAYYATREFDKTTMEPPLGSGPYKVGDFAQGRYIIYERPRRLLGPRSAGQQGAVQFRPASL